jgi:hypothetical protein
MKAFSLAALKVRPRSHDHILEAALGTSQTITESMNHRYTKRQTPRETLPDAQTNADLYLFKNVKMLRATYQVKLLTFLASEAGKNLIIDVPEFFTPHSTLSGLMKEFPKTIRLQKSGK